MSFRTLRIFLCAAGLLVGSLTQITPAVAGTNGQHIYYCSDATTPSETYTYGFNQNGQWVPGEYVTVELIDDFAFQCVGDNARYWWVGQVTIYWYYDGGGNNPTSCTVPKSQSGDYTYCWWSL